jgi:hypothetical protein
MNQRDVGVRRKARRAWSLAAKQQIVAARQAIGFRGDARRGMQRLGVTPQAVGGLDGDDASALAGEPRRIAAAAGADVEDEP